jgi:hypothetical protein
MGSEGIAPCIANLSTRRRRVVSFMPRQLISEETAGWIPEPVLTLWRTEESIEEYLLLGYDAV